MGAAPIPQGQSAVGGRHSLDDCAVLLLGSKGPAEVYAAYRLLAQHDPGYFLRARRDPPVFKPRTPQQAGVSGLGIGVPL